MKTTLFAIRSHDGILKWKSQEITKAKTIQASRKFRNRCPCQKFLDSAPRIATGAAADAESFESFHCSVISVSLGPVTFRAVDPQISQILGKSL
ncbi:hypothetical protein V6N13_137186 [Hibiscus sabdariffa]|uniref:Uncharacterized protein n=1 Tax=Hibiscus sabdariffa TaxID=183260 RepID=A0ABR2DPB2_9ROSI